MSSIWHDLAPSYRGRTSTHRDYARSALDSEMVREATGPDAGGSGHSGPDCQTARAPQIRFVSPRAGRPHDTREKRRTAVVRVVRDRHLRSVREEPRQSVGRKQDTRCRPEDGYLARALARGPFRPCDPGRSRRCLVNVQLAERATKEAGDVPHMAGRPRVNRGPLVGA